MEVNEFKRILEIGLGRAILFLQTHDTIPYREAILEACLRDTRYDFIMESRRSRYLFDAITLTGSLEFFREPILQALRNSPDPNANDTDQLAGLATRLAEQGDPEARQLVYDHFVAHINSDNCNGFLRVHDLIVLDGVDGFLFAAEWFGKRLPEASEYSPLYFFPREAEEWGEDDHAYWNAAMERAGDNPHLAAYVAFEQEHRTRQEGRSRRRKPLSALSYDKLKRKIVTTDREYGLEMWGRRASEEDLERAATDLLKLMDVDIQKLSEEHVVLQQTALRKYLRIFRKRPFPLDPQKLIALASQARNEPPACDENDWFTLHTRLILAALNALGSVNHPAVRQLAFELIEGRQWIGDTVILLKSNWQNSDWSVLEALTRETFEPFEYHGLGMDIRELFEAHPSPDATQTLINLYNYGPCSECRERYVKALESIQAVPDWMHEECRYDANLDLREWAEEDK